MKSIKGKILFTVLISILVVAILIGGITFVAISNNNTRSLEHTEEQLRYSYDHAIEVMVDVIISELDGITHEIEEGLITEEEGKTLAADLIRNAHYDNGEGYFWADDLEGNNVAFLGNKDVEGSNRLDLQDTNGQYIIKDLISIAKNGGGYYDYYFAKPGETEALPKRAYIKLFEPFGWAVGTGNYTDDIDELILKEKESLKTEFYKIVSRVVGVSLVVLLVCLGFSVYISNSIIKPIKLLTTLVERTAELNVVYDDSFEELGKAKDETGTISRSVLHLRRVLRKIIEDLQENSEVLNKSTNDLNGIVTTAQTGINGVTSALNEFADGTTEQANESQAGVELMNQLAVEISEAVEVSERIYETTGQVNRRNEEGIVLAKNLDDKFEITRSTTEELNENVANLSKSSNQIGDITSTIKSIAEQTNLLALNAAIEAARAGEAGKGFAVVADEIRKLAEQTSQSTTKIEDIVGDITNEIDVTMTNMTNSKEAVDNSSSVVVEVSSSFNEIGRAMKENYEDLQVLIENIKQVDLHKSDTLNSIEGISAITEENAAGTEEISATMDSQNELMNEITNNTESLSEISELLYEVIGRFKI